MFFVCRPLFFKTPCGLESLDNTVFESRALSSGTTLFALFAICLDFLGQFGTAFLKRLAAESTGSRAVADLLAVFTCLACSCSAIRLLRRGFELLAYIYSCRFDSTPICES
jgi:hypothetical protein